MSYMYTIHIWNSPTRVPPVVIQCLAFCLTWITFYMHSTSVYVKYSHKSVVCGCSTGTCGAYFLSLSFSFSNAVLYTETRYTRTSGSMHDEGLPVLSPISYDSLEANHKIVIEVSYTVTLERYDNLTYHVTSGRTTCIDAFDTKCK